jgi:hypothetical protein
VDADARFVVVAGVARGGTAGASDRIRAELIVRDDDHRNDDIDDVDVPRGATTTIDDDFWRVVRGRRVDAPRARRVD